MGTTSAIPSVESLVMRADGTLAVLAKFGNICMAQSASEVTASVWRFDSSAGEGIL